MGEVFEVWVVGKEVALGAPAFAGDFGADALGLVAIATAKDRIAEGNLKVGGLVERAEVVE